MFHYNKTWNERSLSKCLREEEAAADQSHNYENIYSCDKDDDDDEYGIGGTNPVYENVRFGISANNNFVSLTGAAEEDKGTDNAMVIGQLTRSPRSSARKVGIHQVV
jgi:hypothetical protein